MRCRKDSDLRPRLSGGSDGGRARATRAVRKRNSAGAQSGADLLSVAEQGMRTLTVRHGIWTIRHRCLPWVLCASPLFFVQWHSLAPDLGTRVKGPPVVHSPIQQ